MKTAFVLPVILLLFSSCNLFDDIFSKKPKPVVQDYPYGTGWNNDENFSQTIPVAINYGNYQATNSSLPPKVDLTSQFPPIGNQGQLGTCVAWATAYNDKSYLDAVASNLSFNQLQSSNNQYSPTDLFFAIDPSKRSCDHGTNFDDAFAVLINRGVNTLSDVPYQESCNLSSPGNSSTASAHRIRSYRRIEGSVNEVKEYLSQGVPVVMGAMVNNQFMQWRGSGVLMGLDYSVDRGAGHAMTIAGYDDSIHAFRIINSWSTIWGDQGYAWIDYDFLVNSFCIQGGQKSLFVAFNENTVKPPAPNNSNNAPDLTALVVSDYSLYPSYSPYVNARVAFFDVKNIGDQAILASSNWNIYYLWVDAFNANNYGVIFRGELTTSIPQNTYQDISATYSRINFDLAPGASLGQTIGLNPINWGYFMPSYTGNFYLVLYIDKGSSNETNLTNNVFYVTQSPKFFNNGYSLRNKDGSTAENKRHFQELMSFKHDLSMSDLNNESSILPFRKLSDREFENAYSSDEIVSFLKYKIKNGGL